MSFWNEIGKYLVMIFVVIFAIGVLLGWTQACKQASIFNRINNTAFSCSDFFWAADQINAQTQTIKLIK